MIRDISPPAWNAKGTASLSLAMLLTELGSGAIPEDTWVSNYPNVTKRNYNLTGTTNNQIDIPDTTNNRFVVIIMPRNSGVAWKIKGVSGDTGIAQHPNGFAVFTLPASGGNTSFFIYCDSAITGCTIYFI